MSRILLAAGATLLFVAAVLAVVLHTRHPKTASTVTVSLPAHTTTTTTTVATTTAPAPPPPPQVAMSWQDAGALLVHPTDVDPAQLAQEMRSAGFGWAAVDLATIDPDWIARFRAASGFPVGGWSVLGDDATGDAEQAVNLVKQNDLAFYIADAEAAYGYTFEGSPSSERYARSQRFIKIFRAAEPSLPAAVSSYCRPDRHDLDWSAWASAGFEFLPQAYVNDFGAAAAPRMCVEGAAKWFPASHVHPTIGSYAGTRGIVQPSTWIALLRAAKTTGFSIYPGEVGMSPENWQAYGSAISGLAQRPVPTQAR